MVLVRAGDGGEAFVDEDDAHLARAAAHGLPDVLALAADRKAYAGEIVPKASRGEGREVAGALKRQLGMLTALDAMVARQIAALLARLEERGKPYRIADWLNDLRGGAGAIVPRPGTLRKRLMLARDGATTARDRADRDAPAPAQIGRSRAAAAWRSSPRSALEAARRSAAEHAQRLKM